MAGVDCLFLQRGQSCLVFSYFVSGSNEPHHALEPFIKSNGRVIDWAIGVKMDTGMDMRMGMGQRWSANGYGYGYGHGY